MESLMKEINFTVTVDEANLILRGIGLLPFAEVYQLVARLQQQAGRQFERDTGHGEDRRPSPAPAPVPAASEVPMRRGEHAGA
jgi:hypothetical protein